MTQQEFDAWTAHTERSRRGWQRDEVTLHNRGELLMYHGGEDGTYVRVYGTTVEVGSYEGAVPHIGEAMFKLRGKRTFDTASDAYSAVASATGINGLMAMLTGSSH